MAPDHGSVWFRGQEFRTASNAGIPATESLKITCDKHYKLTEIGSAHPQCLPSEQWEVGKTCEEIYSGSLENGQVSTHDFGQGPLRAGIAKPWMPTAWVSSEIMQHVHDDDKYLTGVHLGPPKGGHTYNGSAASAPRGRYHDVVQDRARVECRHCRSSRS